MIQSINRFFIGLLCKRGWVEHDPVEAYVTRPYRFFGDDDYKKLTSLIKECKNCGELFLDESEDC